METELPGKLSGSLPSRIIGNLSYSAYVNDLDLAAAVALLRASGAAPSRARRRSPSVQSAPWSRGGPRRGALVCAATAELDHHEAS